MTSLDSLKKPKYSPYTCYYCYAIIISRNLSVYKLFKEQRTLDVTFAQARNAADDGCKLFEFLMQRTPGERESRDCLCYTLSYDEVLMPSSSISFLYPATSQDPDIHAGDEGTSDSFPAPPFQRIGHKIVGFLHSRTSGLCESGRYLCATQTSIRRIYWRSSASGKHRCREAGTVCRYELLLVRQSNLQNHKK
jgi:hypothetical protein